MNTQAQAITQSNNYVEVESGGQALRCYYDYSPGRPGVHTLRNGDPGYPDEPEEFEVTLVLMLVGSYPTEPTDWIDISDLVSELDGFPVITELAWERFETEAEEARAGEPEDLPDDYAMPSDYLPADYNPLGDPQS